MAANNFSKHNINSKYRNIFQVEVYILMDVGTKISNYRHGKPILVSHSTMRVQNGFPMSVLFAFESLHIL